MNIERLVTIQPAEGSVLARQLAALQELQARSRAAERELATIRDQRMEAGRRLRWAAATRALDVTLDELQAAAEVVDTAFNRQLQVCKPLGDALATAEDAFYRNYMTFLQANRAAEQARRLGG
jgi:hypothetical protein